MFQVTENFEDQIPETTPQNTTTNDQQTQQTSQTPETPPSEKMLKTQQQLDVCRVDDPYNVCGLQVRLNNPDSTYHQQTGIIINNLEQGTRFKIALDDENQTIEAGSSEIIPLNNISSPGSNINLDRTTTDTVDTTDTTDTNITDKSLKTLFKETIKVWNQIFNELISLQKPPPVEAAFTNQEITVDAPNAPTQQQIGSNNLEKWWMDPFPHLQKIHQILTRDNRIFYVGLFLICSSFFVYFILVSQ